MKRVSMPWSTAYTQTPTKKFIPAAPWSPSDSAKHARGAFELIAAQTNQSVTFACPTADVENSTDTATDVVSAQTSDGMNHGAMPDISSITNAKQLVKFWYNCTNANASARVLGRADGFADINGEG